MCEVAEVHVEQPVVGLVHFEVVVVVVEELVRDEVEKATLDDEQPQMDGSLHYDVALRAAAAAAVEEQHNEGVHH
jgi:hypothetical protein